MAWKEMFDEKFMTAEEAAKMINSGDVVWVGGGSGLFSSVLVLYWPKR